MKRILSLLSVVGMLLLLLSCAGEGAPEGAFSPVTLTDAAGRTTVFDAPAERIVSCYYISTSAVLALGMKDRLVGIEKKAETRPICRMTDEALLGLPQVGSMKELNVEAIAALEPDLILLPLKCVSYAETFDALGLKTLVVSPEDDAGLREMLTLIGGACGGTAAARAEELLAYYDTVQKRLTGAASPLSVLMTGNASYLTAAPDGMYQGAMLAQLGVRNAAGALEGNYWTEISFESFLAMDPDVIVLPSDAAYTAEELRAAFTDAGLPLPEALKTGAVYRMPGCFEAWDSPVPSSVLGLLWLNTVLNGGELTDSFREEVKVFYETYYGFTPEDALLDGLVG